MKTLTLFRAFIKASDGFWCAECNLLTEVVDEKGGGEIRDRRGRQSDTFEVALTKRLQEQEEELELLKAYSSDTAVLLHVHGFDYARWHENYEKEKQDV